MKSKSAVAIAQVCATPCMRMLTMGVLRREEFEEDEEDYGSEEDDEEDEEDDEPEEVKETAPRRSVTIG